MLSKKYMALWLGLVMILYPFWIKAEEAEFDIKGRFKEAIEDSLIPVQNAKTQINESLPAPVKETTINLFSYLEKSRLNSLNYAEKEKQEPKKNFGKAQFVWIFLMSLLVLVFTHKILFYVLFVVLIFVIYRLCIKLFRWLVF